MVEQNRQESQENLCFATTLVNRSLPPGLNRWIEFAVDIKVYEHRGVGIAEFPFRAGTVFTVFSRLSINGHDRLSFPSLEAVHSWLDRSVETVTQHGTSFQECYFNAAELCEILDGV